MDDRRFDALVKSLASGTNRRNLLKGVLGLGGVAVTGGALLDSDVQAARRPTPTPKPPSCPGNQVPCTSGCCCPSGLHNCGPDCCTEDDVPAPLPGHSECCDNACCFGTCYGDELCCPTNNRSSGELPIPPTHKICESIDNGTQCCELDQPCCQFEGCCDTICWGDGAFCCPQEAFCRGGGGVEDVCCVNEGSDRFACCSGGTDSRVCYDTSVEGACCTDTDCGDPCQVCNPATNICEPRCDAVTQVCCIPHPGGPGICATGECCGFDDCGEGRACCDANSGTVCVDQGFCPNPCSADRPCIGCSTCDDGLCLEGCGEGEECCFTDAGELCFEAGSCGPNGCICEGGLDCCIINDEYVCVDLTQAGVCCTDTDCGDACLVCNQETFSCEPRCEVETQICCAGQAGSDVCVTGACCSDGQGCDVGQNCCVEDDGAGPFTYCTAAPCECDRMCSDAGLACCTIDNVFVWCYDQNVGCCTVESCLAGEFCCGGTCTDLECETSTQCSSDSDCGGDIVCCVGDCCTAGQSCVTDPNNNSYCE